MDIDFYEIFCYLIYIIIIIILYYILLLLKSIFQFLIN